MQQNITKSAKFNGLIVGVLLSLKFILSAQKLNFMAFLALFISIFIIVLIVVRMLFVILLPLLLFCIDDS